MEMLEKQLIQIVYFFINNWIAAAILAVIIVIGLIKKPKELFKIMALIVFAVGILYVLIFLEKSMFSGVSSKEQSFDIERKSK